MEAIMDMIGKLQFIESKLGRYNSRQGNGKPPLRHSSDKHSDYLKVAKAGNEIPLSDPDIHVGRNIDITA